MVLGIIQDRTGNSRLPEKGLKHLGGKPMSVQVYERVKSSHRIDVIVMATTQERRDDVICGLAKISGLHVFRGSTDDVTNRFYECAKSFGADYIVRMCADNPLIEAEEIDKIIDHAIENNLDFCSNTGDCASTSVGYPDGIGAEVYSMKMLANLNEYAKDREHPHKNITIHKNGLVCSPEYAYPQIRLDVNTQEDYDFVKSIYDKYENPKIREYIGGLI